MSTSSAAASLGSAVHRLRYFAYGSNMAEEQMSSWCSDYRCLGAARLPDHRLAFVRDSPRWKAGAADVVRHRGREVWGVLYECSAADLASLDRKEGAGPALGYRRVAVEVELAARRRIRAITYVVISKAPRELPPLGAYVDLMLAGAREHGFPERYVEELQALRERAV